MIEGKLDIIEIVDNPDGGCTMTIDMTDDVAKTMASYGIKFVLYCAAYEVSIDEAFKRIAGEV